MAKSENGLEALKKVIERAKLIEKPKLDDNSLLKIAFVLIGSDMNWRVSDVKVDGLKLTFDLVGCFVSEEKYIKHGGRVTLTNTWQTRLVMELNPADRIEVNRISDEKADGKADKTNREKVEAAKKVVWPMRLGGVAAATA